MGILKFVLIIFVLILIVFIANITNTTTKETVIVKEESHLSNEFSYDASNILVYDSYKIKSIAGINLNSSYTNLATIFGVDENSIDNSILRKVVRVLNYDSDIVVFPRNNSIEQITLKMRVPSSDITSINVFIDNIVNSAKAHNIPASIEKIEGVDGNIIANIITYNITKYKLIMTKSFDNNEVIFVIDVINNFY